MQEEHYKILYQLSVKTDLKNFVGLDYANEFEWFELVRDMERFSLTQPESMTFLVRKEKEHSVPEEYFFSYGKFYKNAHRVVFDPFDSRLLQEVL